MDEHSNEWTPLHWHPWYVMGICQGDPLGGVIFFLAHFKVLYFIANCFLFCLFPSIANDTHIIGPPLILSSTYEHFKLNFVWYFIQPLKCVTWSPSGLLLDFNTPSQFTTHQRVLKTWGLHWAFQLHIIFHQIFNMWTFFLEWVMLRYLLEF